VALSLKDKETDRLAREVAALTGETLTDAIRKALTERLERERFAPRRIHPARRPADGNRPALRGVARYRHTQPGRDCRL
jgi:hypothetical protein